jgi:hypothetical protein
MGELDEPFNHQIEAPLGSGKILEAIQLFMAKTKTDLNTARKAVALMQKK